MSRNFNVLVLGTTCLDKILYAGDLTSSYNTTNGTLSGKTTPLKPPRLRPGGSAINTALAIGPIAEATGLRATVYKSMRLGRRDNNPGKDRILEALGNPNLHDRTIMDGMFGTDYEVPVNTVIENGSAEHHGRMVVRAFPQDNIALNPQIFKEIGDAVDQCDIIMGNSNPVDETLHAFTLAKEKGIPTILDYSEKDPEAMEKAAALIPLAKYIVAPHDAKIPGMKREDSLFDTLVDRYEGHHIAVSNGDEDVRIYSNGKRTSLSMHKVKVTNVNGAGDTRDAALVCALMAGHTFEVAMKTASDLAELYVQLPDREHFFEILPDYFERTGAHIPAQRSNWWEFAADPAPV